MGWSRRRLQTCQLSPRAGRPEGLVELSVPEVYQPMTNLGALFLKRRGSGPESSAQGSGPTLPQTWALIHKPITSLHRKTCVLPTADRNTAILVEKGHARKKICEITSHFGPKMH